MTARIWFSILLAACGGQDLQHVDASVAIDASVQHDAAPSHDAAACALGPEATVAACTDGCDNDGDGHVDGDDYDCCGIVPNTACPAAKNVCPGVASTWTAGALTGTTTYHEVATATATFAATPWIWQCSGTPSTSVSQMLPPAPGIRQLLFHVVVPAGAPMRTVLTLQPSATANMRYWTMATCGESAACVPPPVAFNGAGTVIGALVPGAEIYFVLEADGGSTAPVSLPLDLTNQ